MWLDFVKFWWQYQNLSTNRSLFFILSNDLYLHVKLMKHFGAIALYMMDRSERKRAFCSSDYFAKYHFVMMYMFSGMYATLVVESQKINKIILSPLQECHEGK